MFDKHGKRKREPRLVSFDVEDHIITYIKLCAKACIVASRGEIEGFQVLAPHFVEEALSLFGTSNLRKHAREKERRCY